jgi:hypothetical protein
MVMAMILVMVMVMAMVVLNAMVRTVRRRRGTVYVADIHIPRFLRESLGQDLEALIQEGVHEPVLDLLLGEQAGGPAVRCSYSLAKGRWVKVSLCCSNIFTAL